MADNSLDRKIKDVDNTSPMGGGSFILRELTIMSPSSPNVVHLNSPGVFEELNIYEDLFSNVLRGTFTFIDNQGLAETIPIIGDETLIISFSTPGAGSKQDSVGDDLESGTSSEEVFEQRFRVYDCIEDTTGEKAKFYKLFFVSPEYIINTKSKISKGYKGRFYHHIVKDALKKINKKISLPWQKKVFIEKTATPQNVIVPNWTPFQAINFCASRSLSSAEEDTEIETPEKNQAAFAPGSLFVFYEKLGTGFFYESIETMIVKQSTKKRVPLYQYVPKTAGKEQGPIGVEFFGVEKFEFKGSFRVLENLGFGMYGSKLIAYDPIRMKYDEVKYDYYEKKENPTTSYVEPKTGATVEEPDPSQEKDDSQRVFADFIATDIHPTDKTQNKLISDSSDLLGSNEASIKLATTTKDHDAMFVSPPAPGPPTFETYSTGIGVTSKTFKDDESKPNQVENWLLQREMQLQEYGNIVVTFNVAGNSARHVGDLIRFEIPSAIAPDEMGSVDIGHQLYSGYYLVSKIRHIITINEYKTDLELIKNSFAKRIPGQATKQQEAADTTIMTSGMA